MSEQEIKNELEPEPSGLYAVGRTSTHGGYNGFASLPIMKDQDGQWVVNPDGDCTSVPFHASPSNAYVTWFTASKRRDVLTLFSRFPKSFERCELVSLKSLRADHLGVPRYAQMVGRGLRTTAPKTAVDVHDFDVPTPDGKRTYLRIRIGDTVFISPRSSVQVEEITLSEQEFKSIVDR